MLSLKRSVRPREEERPHACLCHACGMVLLPTGPLLSFVRLQGVEKRETKIESPVTKTSPTQALSSLIYSPKGDCRNPLKNYAQLAKLVNICIKQ